MFGYLCSVILAGTCITAGNGFLLDTKPPPSIPRDGVYFWTNKMIRMTFNEFPAKDFTYLRVGFQTKKMQGILLQIRDESNYDYMSLSMNNNGGVKYFVQIGLQRFQLNTRDIGMAYADGLPHDVIVRRSVDGRNVSMQMITEGADANRTKVDSFATAYGAIGSWVGNFTLNKPKYLYIGNNDTDGWYSYRGFEGCITQMQIDNFYPLQTAFQVPKPSYVESFYGSTNLRPNTCGCVIKVWDPYSRPVPTKPLYAGQIIPMKLRPDMMVKYSFNRTLEYYINSYNTLITAGFVTDVSQGTLVKIEDSSDSYLSLEIKNNGSVTFSFHDGSYEFALNSSDSVNVADGRPHTLRLRRAYGQTQIELDVDGNPVYDMLDCRIQTWLEERKNYLYIGNSNSTNAETGFEGCIYGLIIGNFDYPHDKYTYIDVISNGMYDIEKMLYNETTSADYIRSICGMESLKNSTATLDDGLVLNDQSD